VTNRLTAETRKLRRIIERFRAAWLEACRVLAGEHIEKMLAKIDKASAKRHWLSAIRGLMARQSRV
jgi:hypothetical protein